MERESFESEEVAHILNSNFISIKVREVGWGGGCTERHKEG